jgi:hypothetical protein
MNFISILRREEKSSGVVGVGSKGHKERGDGCYGGYIFQRNKDRRAGGDQTLDVYLSHVRLEILGMQK